MLANLELLEDRLCLSVSLSSVFADHMVLQRDMPIQITGSAQSGEGVTVTLAGPAGTQTQATRADSDGVWSVTLGALPAGGDYTLTASGQNRVVVSDVLIGDVWVCSGQSNMVLPLSSTANGAAVAAQANQPTLRYYDPNVGWTTSNSTSAAEFSAVAYYFGRAIQQDQGVPVGLMEVAVNATSLRRWTSWDAVQASPALAPYRQAIAAGGGVGSVPGAPPGDLFNTLVRPLTGLAITGVIWYQGEADYGRPAEYAALFPTMITSWRQAWHEGDFPFLYVQLASDPGADFAPLRQAQLDTVSAIPNTAMAVVLDGQAALHPTDKELPADRLALAARALAYGENVDYTGPWVGGGRLLGNQVVLDFQDVGAGLVFRDGVSASFELEDAFGHWFPARAVIDGSSIRVWNDTVAAPVAVRYAWGDVPDADLFNADGLPASPFEVAVADLSHMPAPLRGPGVQHETPVPIPHGPSASPAGGSVPVSAPAGRTDALPVLPAVPVAGLSNVQALAPSPRVAAAADPSGNIGAGEYNGGSNGLVQSAPANSSPPAAVPQSNADAAILSPGVGDSKNSDGREQMNRGEAGNTVPTAATGGMNSLDLTLPIPDATDVVFAEIGREPDSSRNELTLALGYAAAFALARTRATIRDRLQYDRRNALSLPSFPD
jgi:sialate O-acetylesterase